MTDVTQQDIQNMTPEQLAALADAIKAEQSASAQVDTLLGETAATAGATSTGTSAPAVAAVPTQNEAPINPIAQAVLNGVNVATQAAVAAEPVVAIIDPPAGAAIALAVAVVNSLEAMAGWLGMIPPGTATIGIQAEMAKIRSLMQE